MFHNEAAFVELSDRLGNWATQMAARFGSPVYLTGSCMMIAEPRDVDIRCIIEDDAFIRRYGDINDWCKGCWLPNKHDGSLRYAADMYALSKEIAEVHCLNIDFAVQPIQIARQFKDRPKHRIDKLNIAELKY